ncbi:MAG TPA: AAA-like domain-containing protein [Blastocatellia bacterium]|nr:AAA-like domain-containing protein [Blastocatellia bacterium]
MTDNYYDLDVLIQLSGGTPRYSARAESKLAKGVFTHTFDLPFTDENLNDYLELFGPPRRVRSAVRPDEVTPRGFGNNLYQALFNGPVGHCLHQSQASASKKHAKLRIRLRLNDVPKLANLPWEFLYDEYRQHLALDNQFSLVRYIDLPFEDPPLAKVEQLSILVLISTPDNQESVAGDQELDYMQGVVAKLGNRVRIKQLETPSLEALQRELKEAEVRREPYHVFHYIGHGWFDRAAEEGTVVLENDEKHSEFESGDRLATILHNHRTLRLAILNCCDSAQATSTDIFSGVAQSLTKMGIPAVIAMQFEISDEAAIVFARNFYESLARGETVESALTCAREQMFSKKSLGCEWGTPVLYLRAPNSRLFDIVPAGDSADESAPPALSEPSQQQLAVKLPPEMGLPPAVPSGTLSPQSRFYVERSGVDSPALASIRQKDEGVTISIQACGQAGGSSFLRRMIEAAQEAGKEVALINFTTAFNDLDFGDSVAFHRRFCAVLANRLSVPNRMDDWDEWLSLGDNCSNYVRRLLQPRPRPLVIALDEVDRLLDTRFRSSFFAILRNWHNDRHTEECFNKLDLVLVTSLEPHKLIDDPNQSPFNVTEVVELQDFGKEEVERLNQCYGSPLKVSHLMKLMGIIGGHPYLWQSTLYLIARGTYGLDEFIDAAYQDKGPFGTHLSAYGSWLRENESLRNAMIKVLRHEDCDEPLRFKLRRRGLVRPQGNTIVPRCELYNRYFKEYFNVK